MHGPSLSYISSQSLLKRHRKLRRTLEFLSGMKPCTVHAQFLPQDSLLCSFCARTGEREKYTRSSKQTMATPYLNQVTLQCQVVQLLLSVLKSRTTLSADKSRGYICEQKPRLVPPLSWIHGRPLHCPLMIQRKHVQSQLTRRGTEQTYPEWFA